VGDFPMRVQTKRIALAFVAVGLVYATAGTTRASIVTFIGSDNGANSTDPRPNSDAAAAAFDAAAGALGSAGLITFESAPLGTYSSLMVAPGVTLTGTDFTGNSSGQSILDAPFGSPDRLYGYNTTPGGSRFAFVNGGFIDFTFGTPIQAFGAYLSGIQLANETITFDDGTTQTITIPFLPDGGIAFVGFTDPGSSIVSVRIDTRTADFPLGDFIAVDDVRYVATTAVVPEPSTSIAFGLAGLLGLAAPYRRRKSAVA